MSSERPPFAVEPEVVAVLETLWRNDHAAYLVGGGVRDALLGLPGSDWDVATDARPERILAVFPGGTYENRFGTVLARGLRDHHLPARAPLRRSPPAGQRHLQQRHLRGPGPPRPDHQRHRVGPRSGDGGTAGGPCGRPGRPPGRLVRAVGDASRRFDEDALRLLRARAHRGQAGLHHRAGDMGGHGDPCRRYRVGLGRARLQRGQGHAGPGPAVASLPTAARVRHPGHCAAGTASARGRWRRGQARAVSCGRSTCSTQSRPGSPATSVWPGRPSWARSGLSAPVRRWSGCTSQGRDRDAVALLVDQARVDVRPGLGRCGRAPLHGPGATRSHR